MSEILYFYDVIAGATIGRRLRRSVHRSVILIISFVSLSDKFRSLNERHQSKNNSAQ
ncbi:MAG: hypothetical protein N2747_03205 [Chitinophagaceae bacterium]|nr:hypothetical protein [Chitinophagaceae bacterium]